MFKSVLKFEAKMLFTRRNFIILGAIFALLVFFIWDGISDYNSIQKSKKPFQEMEKDKVSRHIHYTFYGIRGVRLLFIPSPISIFFSDSAAFDGMTAHVDTAENLNISNSFKGKDLFAGAGGYMDFSGIMLLVGSFLGLLYGYDVTRNSEYLKLLSDISGTRKPALMITLARIILLNLAFLILSGLSLLFLLINGINAINIFLFGFVVMLFQVLTSFISAGAVVGYIKKKRSQLTILVVIYFLLILFIPWLVQKAVYMEAKKGLKSISEFNHEMYKIMMALETRSFKTIGTWKSGDIAPDKVKAMVKSGQEIEYKKLKKNEMEMYNGIKKRIRAYQLIASFFPTTAYLSVNKELSSKGFENFIKFYRYAYDMKYKFIGFYIERKFYRPLPKSGVEPFIKGNEDLFYGQSLLPQIFLLSSGLTLFYIAGLLFLLYRFHPNEPEKATKKPIIDFKKDSSTLFALCENGQVKGNIFHYYQTHQNAVCIDTIKMNLRFTGIRAGAILKYFCSLAGVKQEKAINHLSTLGITDLNTLNLSQEAILKIYAAVKVAADRDIIVLNDFFKMKSREFENAFSFLLSDLEQAGKWILYLSCEMHYPKVNADKKIPVENFALFPLNFQKVTLR